MLKIHNTYREASIMDLNLMGVYEIRQRRSQGGLAAMLTIAMIGVLAMALAAAAPRISFLAECQNVGGGDICRITIDG